MTDTLQKGGQPSPDGRYAGLPERDRRIGEMVRVRTRRWLVEEVAEPSNGGSSRVRLACADDDAQGQELEVSWEYELDRAILDDDPGRMERGFDRPEHFAAFLNTLRWNCTTATDPSLFQAPFRARIKIEASQMEPLRKALRLPRVNLFIADDTGLGKTIEAGLIVRELLLRRKVRTIVVAAPPSVLEQWKGRWACPQSPSSCSISTSRGPIGHGERPDQPPHVRLAVSQEAPVAYLRTLHEICLCCWEISSSCAASTPPSVLYH